MSAPSTHSEVIYDALEAGSRGIVDRHWWALFLFFFGGSLIAAYAIWSKERRNAAKQLERVRRRVRFASVRVWALIGCGLFASMILIIGRMQSYDDRRRMRQGDFMPWTGVLTSDRVRDVHGGRRPRDETDALIVGDMLFTIICTEPSGHRRVGDAGACPPFQLGEQLTVFYVPLPGHRYRLAALQIRKAAP